MKHLIYVAILLSTLLLVSCAQRQPERPSIIVAAASDLERAGKALDLGFRNAGGAPVQFSFGASAQLEQQILGGAPFDAYAPADLSYCQSLAQAGRIQGACRVYAAGGLVSWSESLHLKSLEDLKLEAVKKFAIANPQIAPYGRAAKEALQRAGLWDALQSKLVITDSVAQAFQLAQTKNADVALVARALVVDSGGFSFTVDTRLYQPIQQTIAVLKSAHDGQQAARFGDFLFSPQGRAILDHFGFGPPPPSEQQP